MRFGSIKYLTGQGFKSVWKNKMMSFASFCIMLVSLLLVGMCILATINLNKVISGVAGKNEVVVIVVDGTDEEGIAAVGEAIDELSNIEKSVFYSRDEAWEDMVADMTEEQQEVFKYAEDDNPLPDTYRVTVADIEKMTDTTNQLTNIENVEKVTAPTEFADVLVSIRNIFSVVAVALIAALAVVSLVIISNTTRTSVYSRRKEINIMKYVGATNRFINIPFFIEGMLVGILAAVAAFFLTMFVYKGLGDILNENGQILSILGVRSLYGFSDIIWYVLVGYVLAGGVIGAIGTIISTRKYVKV
ncbi:MAG: permease-like cell division protein FtsX [Ruminococcus sp.]|nr:permease-like cell division protein FtsX [Ruminococcus sp.]